MKLLELRNLTIVIHKDKNVYPKLLDQTLIVNEGDVMLITGPNGSGKSSVIKAVVGDVFSFSALEAKGSFYFFNGEEKIKINEDERSISDFAGRVCYVSQDDETSFALVMDCFLAGLAKEPVKNKERYVFDFVKKCKAYDCFFGEDVVTKMTSKAQKLLRFLNEDVHNGANQKTALFLTSKTKSFSGGQAKFLNILSNLVRIQFCELCFLDEPLNNLDYSSVRLFSNIIADLHEKYPGKAFVIVSHCRSIPSINRIVEIDTKTKCFSEVENVKAALRLECNGCFGSIENGRYI